MGSAAVIVTTPELAQHVARWTSPERIHLIPNGVDTAVFPPPAQLPPDDPPIVMFVGRLEPRKNLFALLEAVAALGGAITDLLLNDGLRAWMGQASLELVQTRFSPEATLERLMSFYHEAIARREGQRG